MRMTNIIATGILLTAGFALPASAGTTKPTEVRTTINFEDLSTQAGIEKVYLELRETAEDNCRVNGPNNLTNRIFERNCEARLLSDFVKDINHSGLSAYHTVQTTA